MAGEEKKPYLWRLATVVAVLGLAVMVADKLGMFSRADGPRLAITADLNKFRMPPLKFLGEPKDRDDQKPDSLSMSPPEVLNLRYTGTYVVVAIRNNGNQSANKLAVQPGSSGIALIEWDNGKLERVKFTHEIPVGALDVAHSVEVSAWVETPFIRDSILVTHSTGYDEVALPVKTVPYPKWLSFLGVLVTLPLLLILAGISLDYIRDRNACIARLKGELEELNHKDAPSSAEPEASHGG